MKIEVGLSDLRAAITSAVPHTAKPNTYAGEIGLGVVRLQLIGSGLLVSATDQWTLAASLIEADVHDDEADPVDLTPTSVRSLLTAFPKPGNESAGDDRIRVESRTEPGSADVPSEHPPSSVTFTHTGGLFDGASLTVIEYPTDRFPDVGVALRGLLARQGDRVDGLDLDPALLHRFEAASKAWAQRLQLRPIRQTEGAERGVLIAEVGSRFLGAARVEFPDDVELPHTEDWLASLPGQQPEDLLSASLVWTTSTPQDDGEVDD